MCQHVLLDCIKVLLKCEWLHIVKVLLKCEWMLIHIQLLRDVSIRKGSSIACVTPYLSAQVLTQRHYYTMR